MNTQPNYSRADWSAYLRVLLPALATMPDKLRLSVSPVPDRPPPLARAFLAENNRSGYWLTGSGELCGVFRRHCFGDTPGVLSTLLASAVSHGAQWLNCFEALAPVYSRHGWTPCASLFWDPHQKPNGWQDAFGHPSVVFMTRPGLTPPACCPAVDWQTAERIALNICRRAA